MRNILERLSLERRIAALFFVLLFALMTFMHALAPRTVPPTRAHAASAGSETAP